LVQTISTIHYACRHDSLVEAEPLRENCEIDRGWQNLQRRSLTMKNSKLADLDEAQSIHSAQISSGIAPC
jgi:hypothetical protein